MVIDARKPRDGAFVDQIGIYNPRTDPPTVVLDEEKAIKWIRNGAQPSDPVARMLKKLGTLERVKQHEGTS